MKRKKIILTFALAIIMLATASAAFAFELSYPKAGNIELSSGDSIQQTVRYIYTLLVSLTGIAAFISIALGGAMRLTSGGDPGKIEESKKRILAGLTGGILILLTYLILNFINPSLTTITLTKAPPAILFTANDLGGSFICKEGITVPADRSSLPDQREWLFEEIKNNNCEKIYEGRNPVPNAYKEQNFNIQVIRTPNDPYYYAILLGNQMASPKRFEQCRVIYNNPLTNGAQITKGPLFPENANYIEIGKFANNATESEKEIKFCKDANDCQSSNLFGPYNPKDNTDIQWEFYPSLSPVRQMLLDEAETKVILSKGNDLSGECFVTTQSESNIGAAASFGNKNAAGEWSASIASVIIFPKTNVSSTFACSNQIANTASRLLGGTYNLGSCDINGLDFDCSGYVTAVLREVGLIEDSTRLTTSTINNSSRYFKGITASEMSRGDLIVSNRGVAGQAHVVIFDHWINNIGGPMMVWQYGGDCANSESCHSTRQPRSNQEYFTYKNDCGTF